MTFKRMIVTGLLLTGFAGLVGVRAFAQAAPAATQPAPAPEPWQKEFDSVCYRTQEAMSLTQEELAALIQRCDALLPQIEKLDETRKKVYTVRLRSCRGLYDYVLESKKNAKK